MTYSAQAIIDYKKSIAHKAIEMELDGYRQGWAGDAAAGFNQVNLPPHPFGTRKTTLPPVDDPPGDIYFFAKGATMGGWGGEANNPGDSIPVGLFPPGSTIVALSERDNYPGFVVKCNPWTSLYQPWLDRIDGILEGWDMIPDFHGFERATGRAVDAIKCVTPSSGFDSDGEGWKPEFADAEVQIAIAALGVVDEAAMFGHTAYVFKTNYGPDRIRTTMMNQAQVAFGTSLILGGEQRLWADASEDIMRLCEQAKQAFSFQPTQTDFRVNLKAFSAFVKLAGTVVPPPYDKYVKAVGALADLIHELYPKEDTTESHPEVPPLSGGSAEEVAQNFEQAVLALRRLCFHREEALYRFAQKLRQALATLPAINLHIHPLPGVEPGLAEGETIELDPRTLSDLGNVRVPAIASAFLSASDAMYDAAPAAIWERSGLLGYCASGPQAICADIMQVFDQITTGSGKELLEAGKLLAQAAGDFDETDVNEALAHKGLLEELDRGQSEWTPPAPVQTPREPKPRTPYLI